MILRRIIFPIVILSIMTWVGCEPTSEDVQQQLEQNDYEAIYSFVESRIESGEAELRVNQQPEAFEHALLGLLFQPSDYTEKTARLVSVNINRFQSSVTVDNYLWNVITDKFYTVPVGLHEYLLMNYLEEGIVYHEKTVVIDSIIKTDAGFSSILNTLLRETAILHFDQTDKLIYLAELGNFEEPLRILSRIKELKSSIENLEDRKEQLRDESGLSEYESLQSSVNWELRNQNIDTDSDASNSFIFRGYMVSFMNRIGAGSKVAELYEVRSYSGDTYVLSTTETQFQSQGSFSLRVAEKGSYPWKVKEEYGGFTKDITQLVEVPQKDWQEYVESQQRQQRLSSQQRALQANQQKAERSIRSRLQQLDREKGQHQATIKELRKELTTWLTENL